MQAIAHTTEIDGNFFWLALEIAPNASDIAPVVVAEQ